MKSNHIEVEVDLLSFAESLADAVRPIALRWFRGPLDVEMKADDSPVTRADREIEAELRRLISAAYPSHGILGEEEGGTGMQSRHVWVIDPIDGTKSFITGMPLFGTLIALLKDGVPRLSVIDMPALGDRWTAKSGGKALFNGEVCRTRTHRSLKESFLYTTSPDSFSDGDKNVFDRICADVRLRRFGGDCYAYGLLANGSVDVVIEAGLQPYDYLALVPVVEAAGGVITDWNGKPLSTESDGRVVAAASPKLHAELLHAIQVGAM